MFTNNDMSDDDKLVTMFSDVNIVYLSAKACHHILVEKKENCIEEFDLFKCLNFKNV